MNKIILYKEMTEGVRYPYRIAEVYESIDGCRTRLTNHCFSTEEEAMAVIRDIRNKMEGAE